MADHRKYLGHSATLVLPYLGGARVAGDGRRWRVRTPVAPGWWSFELSGRVARPVTPATAPDLSRLAAFRGHLVGGWIFAGGDHIEAVLLVPEDEPPPLAPAIARRWHDASLVFDALDFETEAEDLVRRALEDERSIEQIAGVGASLRAAFAFALVERLARRRRLRVSPRELKGRWLDVARRGPAAAGELLDEIDQRRRRVGLQTVVARVVDGARRAEELWERWPSERRAEAALEAAGGTLLALRRQGETQIEVTFRFLGERFISIVDAQTLQVHDAGICLDGADREITLESLPSVIREAIETGELVITRHD